MLKYSDEIQILHRLHQAEQARYEGVLENYAALEQKLFAGEISEVAAMSEVVALAAEKKDVLESLDGLAAAIVELFVLSGGEELLPDVRQQFLLLNERQAA